VVFLVYCLALKAGYLPQQASAILLLLAVEVVAETAPGREVLAVIENPHYLLQHQQITQ
jgi:hypothetical protein